MRVSNVLFLFCALVVFPLCANADSDEFYYYNPVQRTALPDPTVIRDGDYFYLFATENTHNIPIYRSPDLVNWEFLHTAFTDDTRPTFVSGGSLWAPDINYINGLYVLYYSMSTWGGEWACGIGVATARRVDGSYQDRGPLFTSEEINVQNSIDPFYIEDDDGSKYLFWGSFHGIYYIQLEDDGLSIKEGSSPKLVSGTLTEGTYIYKHDGYYYLIGSAGSCCDGANSTYHLVVARSTSVTGPYYDKNGNRATQNNLSDMLYGGPVAIGPGHCSEIVEDEAGQSWILYHGYPAEDTSANRCLFLSQVMWDSEGWPYIVGETPAYAWNKPVFGEQNYTYSELDYIEYTGESENYRYMFDTGYVPKENTRIELQCYSYPENDAGEAATGVWRAIYSGRGSSSNGYSLYVNPNGVEWGYFAGGYINDNVGSHEYNTDYVVSADLAEVNINGISYYTDRTTYTSTTEHLTIFTGRQDYPYYGRIYYLKIYEDDKLVHYYVPRLRNEDEEVLFYDKVTKTYVIPSDITAFTYGSVVGSVDDDEDEEVYDGEEDGEGEDEDEGVDDGIYSVPTGISSSASAAYNLSGQKVNDSFRGIVVKDGKKIIRK